MYDFLSLEMNIRLDLLQTGDFQARFEMEQRLFDADQPDAAINFDGLPGELVKALRYYRADPQSGARCDRRRLRNLSARVVSLRGKADHFLRHATYDIRGAN